MNRPTIPLAAAVLIAASICRAAPSPAPSPPAPPTRAQMLTAQIRDGEAKLRATQDAAQRHLLADQIEQMKHELGPFDADGVRLRCQAMWHETLLDGLDTDIKRLGLRAKPVGSAALVLDARLAVRQMASLCLKRGWAWEGTLPKYQFDACGQYLANNLPLVDGLLDGVAGWLAKENSLPAGPDREAFLQALADAKGGIGRMTKAVEAFKDIGPSATRGRDATTAALREFVDGLGAVYSAEAALRELGDRQKKQAAGTAPAPRPPAPAAPSVSAEPAPAPQTPAPAAPAAAVIDEKAALEKIRRQTASLEGEPWAATRNEMDRYTGVAEQGLQMPAARLGALELLDVLIAAADYLQGLGRSKSAYPEYVAARQEALAGAFEKMAVAEQRRAAYVVVRQICDGDRDRRVLDMLPLAPGVAQGLLRASNVPAAAFAGAEGQRRHLQLRQSVDAVLDVLVKRRAWPPKDMTPQLAPVYVKCDQVFMESVDALAVAPRGEPEGIPAPAAAAASFAGDLQRAVQADEAVRVVARYMPARAGPVAAEFIKKMEGLVGNASIAAAQERMRLDEWLAPFKEMATLRLPGPEHAKAANLLSGGTYRNAVSILGVHLTQSLAQASIGSTGYLDNVLDAQQVFRVLRHRAVAETVGLTKAGTANLDAMSIPEKPWSQFVAALDDRLKADLSLYGRSLGLTKAGRLSWHGLAVWDGIYCTVAAAQRASIQARRPGETDLAVLMRHLTETADPAPPDAAWVRWAIGYHTAEGAAAMTAGFAATAKWHCSQIDTLRTKNRLENQLTADDFDPPG